MNLDRAYGAMSGLYRERDVRIAEGVEVACLESRAVRGFVLAGNATFTIVSKKTGARFTYRVRSAKDNADLSFVSVLSGPDNETNYEYLGVIAHGRTYVHGRKSRIAPDAPSERAFAWFFFRAIRVGDLSDVEVWHAGKCGRCGRKLTVPESIASGIGPECARRGST